MSLHGKLTVKIFLMFIVAENTGSVNIFRYILFSMSDEKLHVSLTVIAVSISLVIVVLISVGVAVVLVYKRY